MDRPNLIDARQVAERLGRGVSWFYCTRQTLIDKHGFPDPVPGIGLRWDPVAIDRWLAAQCGEAPPALAKLSGRRVVLNEALASELGLDRAALSRLDGRGTRISGRAPSTSCEGHRRRRPSASSIGTTTRRTCSGRTGW